MIIVSFYYYYKYYSSNLTCEVGQSVVIALVIKVGRVKQGPDIRPRDRTY